MTALATPYAEPDTYHDLTTPAEDWGSPDSAPLYFLRREVVTDFPQKEWGGGPQPDAEIFFLPSNRRVVGLHGFARTGKDTIAEYLRGEGWNQVVLAEPILQALVLLDPIVTADNRGRVIRFSEVLESEGYEAAKKTPEFRRLMQVFGSEVGREYLSTMLGLDLGIWLDIADRKISGPQDYVISDVRFRDEVDLIRKHRGILIKVTRPGYGPVNDHVSDAGLPDHLFDYIVENDGTIEDLHTKVRLILGTP